jgi:invasion protein IalB
MLRGWIWTLPLIRQATSVVGLSAEGKQSHTLLQKFGLCPWAPLPHTHHHHDKLCYIQNQDKLCFIQNDKKKPKKSLMEMVVSKSKKDIIFSSAGFLLRMPII